MKTLIVARYAESLDWLPLVPEDWHIIIVNKGEPMPEPERSAEIISAENVGRETETFLRWIKAADGAPHLHPDDLLAFLQGSPLEHCASAIEQLNIEPNRGGFREFGRTFVCDRNGAPHDTGKRVGAGYEFVFEKNAPQQFRFIVGGQFMATVETIRAVPVDWLTRAYTMTMTWPDGPWIMERLWLYLFGKDKE